VRRHAGSLAPILATACLLSCHPQAPVAALRASTQTLVLPYPQRASLELSWRPLGPLGETAGSPMVFAHLVDREGRVRRTFDHPFPDTWTAGSEVTYPLHLDQSAVAPPLPPGTYDLTMGLYAAQGRRWSLDVEGAEVDDQEYALVEVTIPRPVTPTPRFEFSGGWTAPQDTGTRQVVATRWLGGDDAELAIWGHDWPGEAVLSFSIPRLQEPEFRLRTLAPDTAPAVAVESDCGRVSGR